MRRCSLFIVGVAVAAVFVAVLLSFFGRYQPDGEVRKRRGPLRSVVTFVVAMALLALFVRAVTGSRGPRLQALVPGADGQGAAGPNGQGSRYEPQFALWPVLGVGALVAPGGARLVARRPRSPVGARTARRDAPTRHSRTCSQRRSTTSAPNATRAGR